MIQQTLVLIKPDGLTRSLTGNIVARLSEAKLEIIAAKMVRVSRELAVAHYQHLDGKPFFEELIQYLMGTLHERRKVMAMVYWGEEAIAKVRQLAGATNPEQADPTSIRGSYGRIRSGGLFENAIHASESEAEAAREITLWFRPEEIIVELYPTKVITLSQVATRVWA